jgi:hypothetical protein
MYHDAGEKKKKKSQQFIVTLKYLDQYQSPTGIRLKKTNLMHCLSSVHFVNQPLRVSGIFVAHHQEVYCVYTKYLVGAVLFS